MPLVSINYCNSREIELHTLDKPLPTPAHDPEAILDRVTKYTGVMDIALAAASSVINSMIMVGIWLEKDLFVGKVAQIFSIVVLPYVIARCILMVIALIYQLIHLYWSCSTPKNPEKLQQQFFTTEASAVPAPLARRISVCAAKTVSNLLQHATAEGKKVVSDIVQLQVKKMTLLRVIGILAVILSILCCCFILATFPHVFLITLCLSIVNVVLNIVYHVLEKGYVNQPGHTFSCKACIPKWIRNRFNDDKGALAKANPSSAKVIPLKDRPSLNSPNYR